MKTSDQEKAPYKTLRMVELLKEIVLGTIAKQNVFYKDIYQGFCQLNQPFTTRIPVRKVAEQGVISITIKTVPL